MLHMRNDHVILVFTRRCVELDKVESMFTYRAVNKQSVIVSRAREMGPTATILNRHLSGFYFYLNLFHTLC